MNIQGILLKWIYDLYQNFEIRQSAIYKGFRAGGQIKNRCPWGPLVDKGFQVS